jgi:cell division protein FtsA
MNVVQLQGRNGRGLPGGPKSSIIASLDIGSTKITCLIAEQRHGLGKTIAEQRGALKVRGFGQTASRGIRAGAVVDVTAAECAIRIAVDAAERMAETSISDVYVAMTGGRPGSVSFSGRVLTQTGVVSPRDLEFAVSQALANVNVGKRTILHLNPVNHVLDGVSNISQPLGLHGDELQTDIAITTVDPSGLRNLDLAVSRAHLNVSGFVLAPYAAAKSCLTADELELGTLLIDIGGAMTSIGYVRHGFLVASETIPLGGLHITNDVAQGLSTTLAHAERMKTLWGSVLPDGHDGREMLAVPLAGERGVDSVQKVPKSHLTNILRARSEEIFELVSSALQGPAFANINLARVVLTGGTSQLSGLRELAADVLGLPVRLGQAMAVHGLPEIARGSGFAVAVGGLCYAAAPDRHYAMPEEAQAQFTRSQMSYVRRMGHWLAEAL